MYILYIIESVVVVQMPPAEVIITIHNPKENTSNIISIATQLSE
jgi:hypothetical protein